MLSNGEAFRKLESLISAGWTDTPVVWPNVDPGTDYEVGEDDYAKMEVKIGVDKGMDIGSEGASNVFSQGHGVLLLHVYIRQGQGDRALFDYLQQFQTLVDWVLYEGITFTEKGSYGPFDSTDEGDWRVITCFVNFHFSRT